MIQSIKNVFHLFEAFFSSRIFGTTSSKLQIIGVTGTDGKTTTAHLIYHLLKSCGRSVSIVSSIKAQIGTKAYETGFHTTTPRPTTIQKLLKESQTAGDDYFVLETTSHAIDQNRIWGVTFTIAVLTNITHEHLYHHGTYENYVSIKTRLLLRAQKAIVNRDDTSYPLVKSRLESHHKHFITYSVSQAADADVVWNPKISAKIYGEYNKQNILAAYATCLALGLEEQEIIAAIKTFQLPKGRLDVVYNKQFTVIIDFAHTPHALESVLKSVKSHFKKEKGRIIHVFGAASQRDDTKRPKMGAASARYADIIILTEEDYRTEDFDKICNQIAYGMPVEFGFILPDAMRQKNPRRRFYTRISNRAEAIELAMQMAKRGDTIVLTGKGHETSLNREGREYPWDEYKAVEKALKSR